MSDPSSASADSLPTTNPAAPAASDAVGQSSAPVPALAENGALAEGKAVRTWRQWLEWIARPALCVYWPLLFYLTHSPESPTINAALEPIKGAQPDKWAHTITYMLLTLLMVFASLAGRQASFMKNLNFGCITAAVYGVVDELTQGAFGRTPDGADITADLSAVAIIYIALLLTHRERRTLPLSVLLARILLAAIVPLSGVLLFNEKVGANIKIWKIVPSWMGYIRGDYVAHFLASLGATLLLAAAAPLGFDRRRARLGFIVILLFMLATGPAIEWVQGHFFHRGAEWEDVQAHTWGVFIAAIIWAMCIVAKRAWAPDRAAMIAGIDAPLPMGERAAEGSGAPATDADGERSQRFVLHAMIVGLMTLVSRFTGLIRDAVLAAALGLSATADAFSIGFLIPNLFRRLFGEGALTAAFIPIYTDLVHKDRLTARRLASLCIAVMLVFLGGLTLVGELILMTMITARDWSPDTALALRLTMIMLPYMPMICIVALIGGILQVHGRFGAPAAAPIFLNVVMILGTLAAVQVSGGVETEAKTIHAVTIISWTVLIAGLVQLLWQLAMVLRIEKFTATFAGAGPAFHQMLAMMVPMFIGLGVFQINTLIDYLIAFMLSSKTGGPEQLHLLGMTLDYPMNTGDVAALTWAQRLYQFPLGVFGIAVATAIFPALSRAAAMEKETGDSDGDREKPTAATAPANQSQIPNLKSEISPHSFQSILHQGLRLTFFIGLPASLGLILLRVPITRLIYERGEFGLAESQRVAFVMVGYAAVIWAYSMTHVLTRAFYALKDSKTPLKISLRMVTLNFVLNMILIWTPLGVAGLAWASAASAVMQVVLMSRALKSRGLVPISDEVTRSWRMTGILTFIMTAALLPATFIYDASVMTRGASAVQLAILLPVGAAIVLGGAWLMKADELKWLRRRRK